MKLAINSKITMHTLWHAVTGELPPLALPANIIPSATLDSRNVSGDGLFVAFSGLETDGHLFVGQAIDNGAQAVICEERGLQQALTRNAVVVDCRNVSANDSHLPRVYSELASNTLAQKQVVFIVDDTTRALQAVGGFQRAHHADPQLRVIGITGSVGKTSTKELTASVVAQRWRTLQNKGNLNSDQGLPLTLLELDETIEVAVLEMAMYDIGEIATLCTLARPDVGVITNVGPIHLSRLGTIERIAHAKSELVRALPSAADGGTAILNWDDELVRPMAELTDARIFKYGLSPEADLWADEIRGMGMDGIRFRFHYRPNESARTDSLYVRVPLLGRHSVHTALRAAAVGLVEGLSWEEIIPGMQNMPGQLRLIVVPGLNGSTVIDDTYNAGPDSTIAALNLLDDLTPDTGGRRVAVLGPMLELGEYTEEGHKKVGRRAADVASMLVTVGELGSSIAQEALNVGFDPDNLYIMDDDTQTVQLIRDIARRNDIILVKGSRAVGMDKIVAAINVTDDHVDSIDSSSKG